LSASSVTATSQDLGGGMFQYDFTVTNSTGPEGISGLILLHGNTAFGLDSSSTITAPNGWGFFPPEAVPLLIDSLDYFSFAPAFDVPVGGSTSGFSVMSSAAPGSLTTEGLGAILVSSVSNMQTPVTISIVPEPAAFLLLAYGIGLLWVHWRMNHARTVR
jgi:hypothetical protein